MKKFSLAILAILFFNQHAQALVVGDKFYEIKDYLQECSEKCPEIDYQFIDTKNDWLDAIINRDVILNLQLPTDDEQDDKRWKTFADNPKPNKAQMVNQLNFAIDNFVKANKEWLSDSESGLNYSVSSKPKYMGHKTLKNGHELELFSIAGNQYLGGAHDVGWYSYYVFDMADKKSLKLEDVIMPNQKIVLEKIVKAEYIKYLKENDLDPKEMAETWDFFLTENFTFDDKGMTFLYQPYEITPYVMGMPEFTIPYSRLKGVIKPEYL